MNDIAQAAEQDNSTQEQPQEQTSEVTQENLSVASSENDGASANQPQESIEDLRKQVTDANERVDGMRKKLSEKKDDKVDEYDSLFDDDKSLDDEKRETLKGFTEIMKKNGLSKQQAEGVIKELSQKAADGQGEWKTQTRDELVKELGENASEMISSLEQFANSKVHNGDWSADEKASFNEMVYDARSVKVMNKLLEGLPKSVNLSSDGKDVSQKSSWDKIYSDKEEGYRLIDAGERAAGEKIIREADIEQRRLS